jgi:hypothetical protein
MSLAGWSFILACLAIVISLASVWYSRQQARHAGTMADIEVARAESDRLWAASAQPHVSIIRASSTRTELRIQNFGKSPARDLDVGIDGTGARDCPLVWESDRRLVPVTILAPNATVGLGLMTYDGRPSALHVSLTWLDNRGAGQCSWESVVAWP